MTATIVRRHQFPLCGDRTGYCARGYAIPATKHAVGGTEMGGYLAPGLRPRRVVHRPGATPRTGTRS